MEIPENKRIRELIKHENLTIDAFCKSLDISKSTLSSMFQRNTKPSFDVLSKIAYAYSNYSMHWLLTGEGDMIMKEGPAKNASPEILSESEFVAYLKTQIEELKEENDNLKRENTRIAEANGYYKGLLETNGIAYKQTAS